ncbi:MAG: AMP-binding protein [Sphingopyxis sp.]|nr:AMP-binding protein [Sphingopyxis sp.]
MGLVPSHHAQRKSAGAIAVRHGKEELTWRDLDIRSNRRARLYGQLGVGPGDFVSIALDNSNAFYETSFAIWKLGAIPNPISARLPAIEARAIIDLVRPSLVVAQRSDWLPGAPCAPVDLDLAGIDPGPLPPPPDVPHWRALASGGSTGRPKVIVDHHPALIDPEATYLGQPADGVVLNAGPLYHSGPFVHSHLALFAGATVVSMERFDAEEALRLIAEHRVAWMNLVPTMMQRIWSLPDAVREAYDVSSLEAVWHGAAPMPGWLKEKWIDWIGAEKIWELYGGTENQGRTIINGVDWLAHRGSVGRPDVPGSIRVCREDGSECAPGETGEIYFHVDDDGTYHYLGAEAKRLPGGWETLGDLGWFDSDGFLYIADRRADMIVRGGANIYPAEVEAALQEHPAVASCVVIGLPHPDLGRAVHAIVERQPGASPVPAELADFLAARLAKYKRPESYEFVDAPLRNDAGKIRRSQLRDIRETWLVEGLPFALAPTDAFDA